MGWTTELKGYVKFLRGTTAAYNAITDKNPETLYFIVDQDQETGKLYLGSKLISTGSASQIAGSLKDLSDLAISDNGKPAVESILVYNTTTEKWEDKSIEYVANLITVMVGATDSKDGVSGLVPAPTSDQRNLYLQGDGSWSDPTASLTPVVSTLVGNDSNKSVRTIAAEEATSAVTALINGAPQALDTLGEIATWITNNQDAANIVTLNNAVFGTQQDHSDGLVSKVQVLQTGVGNLQSSVTSLSSRVTSVESDLENLRWKELVEE